MLTNWDLFIAIRNFCNGGRQEKYRQQFRIASKNFFFQKFFSTKKVGSFRLAVVIFFPFSLSPFHHHHHHHPLPFFLRARKYFKFFSYTTREVIRVSQPPNLTFSLQFLSFPSSSLLPLHSFLIIEIFPTFSIECQIFLIVWRFSDCQKV